jgi:diguanylate cyclase (GGDEF)-like protein
MTAQADRLHAPEVADRTMSPRLAARTGGALCLAGALLIAAALALAPGLIGDSTGYWLLCLALAVLGITVLVAGERHRTWAAPLFAFGGILAVTVAIHLGAGISNGAPVLNMLYVWPALFAGYFLGRGGSVAAVATIAVAYCIPAAVSDVDPETLVVRALITVTVVAGTVAVAQVVRGHVHALVLRLDRLARVDPLTALVNRRGFDEHLGYEMERFERLGQPVALVLGDIDRFKALNDRFGHAAGDGALQEIGRALLASVRGIDTVARLGGEEFAVLMPATSASDGVEAAERLRERIAAISDPAGEPIAITFGVASTEQPGCADSASVLLAADRALYEGKARGGNATVLYDGAIARGAGSETVGSPA